MKQRKGLIALLIFGVLIIAFFIFRKQFLRSTMPVVDEIALTEFVLVDDSAFVKLSLTVRNKGVWRIELIHVHLGIYDGTLQLISYDSDTLMTFERNEVRKEELYCTIPYKEVIQRISERQGQDSIGLYLIGELVYSTFLGESSTLVDHRILLNVPIPPRLYLRGVKFDGKEDRDYNLVFDLTLKNDNPRLIVLEDVNYELHVGKNIDLYGHLDDISIAALDSTQLQVPAVVKIGNGLAIISQIVLDRDEMPYSFVMTGTIVSLTGLVEEEIPMAVHTTGQMELYNEDKRDRPKITFRKKQH